MSGLSWLKAEFPNGDFLPRAGSTRLGKWFISRTSRYTREQPVGQCSSTVGARSRTLVTHPPPVRLCQWMLEQVKSEQLLLIESRTITTSKGPGRNTWARQISTFDGKSGQ